MKDARQGLVSNMCCAIRKNDVSPAIFQVRLFSFYPGQTVKHLLTAGGGREGARPPDERQSLGTLLFNPGDKPG